MCNNSLLSWFCVLNYVIRATPCSVKSHKVSFTIPAAAHYKQALFEVFYCTLQPVNIAYFVACLGVTKRRKVVKRGWSDREKAAVRVTLSRYFFINDKLPGKKEIDECIATHECLSGRSWRNVKDFVRNYQRKNL